MGSKHILVRGSILTAFICIAGFFVFIFSRHSTNNISPGFLKTSPSFVPAQILGTSSLVRVIRVIDGDTIELENHERVRYIGINAPESVDPRRPVQCFGIESSHANKQLIEGKLVRLEKDVSDKDKYGRLLRYVFMPLDSGEELFVNLELVKKGYATASTYPPDISHESQFRAAEQSARASRAGLWGSACKGDVDVINASGQCVIKGNINASRKKIYHLPQCSYYQKTAIDTTKGERWFCSEQEAISAGWRKAGNCP